MRYYKEKADEPQIKYSGICSLCNIAATCTFPRDATRPLWFCDEFDCSSIASKCADQDPSAAERPLRAMKPETDPVEKPGEKQLGLCRLCDNRSTCTYPKSPAGVWHCEEYL